MPYVLGVDVGTSRARAAVCRDTGSGWTDPVPVPLGSRQPAAASVVYLGADRSALVGDDAERQVGNDPIRVARGAIGRIGDDVPLVLGGIPCTPQELTAVLIRWVVDRAAEREGEGAAAIVVTHPSEWGGHRKSLLHHELVRQGVGEVTLLAEPIAVAEGYTGITEPGDVLATYGLGAGTADAAVVRKTPAGTFELVADARGTEAIGGGHFDDALMQCVRDQVGRVLDEIDPADPQAWLAMARLRAICTGAKERLSAQPEVVVPVRLPDAPAEIRVTRAEFERVIRPAVAAGADLVPRTVRAAGVSGKDVGAVVLTGGSVRVPLVAELVKAAAPAMVVVAAEPDFSVAVGAAVAARRLLTGPDVIPVPMAAAEHTAVIDRSAIALYAGERVLDVAEVDAEFGIEPPARPPVDVPPIELPEPPLPQRLLTRFSPATVTVSTIVVAAIGIVLTFMFESGSGQSNSTNPLQHLGPAATQTAPPGSGH
jgi:molecular chaperone DnaK (HSP70)